MKCMSTKSLISQLVKTLDFCEWYQMIAMTFCYNHVIRYVDQLKFVLFLLARLHEAHRAIVVTSVVPVYVYVYVYVRVTLSVKVFRSLYLLNMYMYQVDTLHIGRYWSEVLCSTIMTHPG